MPFFSRQIRAKITAAQALPVTMKAGEAEIIYFKVQNAGEASWPSSVETPLLTNMGNHWLHETGSVKTHDDGRTPINIELQPGEEITLPIAVTAPATAGTYTLEIDLVMENMFWFKEKGSETFRFKLRIE